MDSRSKRCEHTDPPVAKLVAESFDQDRSIVGYGCGYLALFPKVVEEGIGRCVVASACGLQPVTGFWVGRMNQLPGQRSNRSANLDRPADSIALPESDLAGFARRRSHDDLRPRDFESLPRRGAEDERLAWPKLVDHLFIQLA